MVAKSHLRGHEIEYTYGEWVYSDTKELTVRTHQERPCGYCGKHSTKEGHDACLGTLQGVMNACCGHGIYQEAYVQFLDGSVVRGFDAITIFTILKRSDDK
jgi:hypothetical protein